MVFVLVIFFFENSILFVAIIDKYADKVDGTKSGPVVTEDEKFRFRDLKTFRLKYWLISISCVVVYTAIFPPLQNMTKLLKIKCGIPEESAPILFGLPYIISACTSPFLGLILDRVGYRAHFSKITINN